MIEPVGGGPRDLLVWIALATATLGFVYLMFWALALRIRIRRPRRPRPARLRLFYLLGLLVAAASPAIARERFSSSSRPFPVTPPWSDPDGFRPPHPSGRTGAHVGSVRSNPPRGKTAPRAGADANKSYRVRVGDSLWSIATHRLGTDHTGSIARYWPRIYDANASTIGADPNLIHPGQELTMPPITESDQ